MSKASEAPPSEKTAEYKLRQAKAKQKYGEERSLKIIASENEIDHSFHSFVATHKPLLWPVIPFNL